MNEDQEDQEDLEAVADRVEEPAISQAGHTPQGSGVVTDGSYGLCWGVVEYGSGQ